jgi:hypothetical protein
VVANAESTPAEVLTALIIVWNADSLQLSPTAEQAAEQLFWLPENAAATFHDPAGGEGGNAGGEGATTKPARIEMWMCHVCTMKRTCCACTGALKKLVTRVLRSLLPWNVLPPATAVNVLPSTLTCT